jgi:phosphate transport system permease protein
MSEELLLPPNMLRQKSVGDRRKRQSFNRSAFSLQSGKYSKRKFVNAFMTFILALSALVALIPLLSVFWYVVQQGASSLNWNFFTQSEAGGGLAHSLFGTLELVCLASVIGIPWGVATAVYLSEYGHGRLGKTVRFVTELLASVPSIIVGLFVYAVIVVPMQGASALAGGLALGILMVPTVVRATEEILKLVPMHLREAGLALGIPRWRVILFVVLRSSLSGISTGVILAVARVAGETAPLLFTALNNRRVSFSLTQPISSLPVQIYTYAISAIEEQHRQAWAGAFVLVIAVFAMNLLTRLVLSPIAAPSKESH